MYILYYKNVLQEVSVLRNGTKPGRKNKLFDLNPKVKLKTKKSGKVAIPRGTVYTSNRNHGFPYGFSLGKTCPWNRKIPQKNP